MLVHFVAVSPRVAGPVASGHRPTVLPIPTLLAEPQSLAARNRLKVVTLTTSAESYARS